jgi:hypothetical protein
MSQQILKIEFSEIFRKDGTSLAFMRASEELGGQDMYST